MNIHMRLYEDSQSYKKHLQNSTQSIQFQQLGSVRNNEEIYPQRDKLGLQKPKKKTRIHGTMDS